MGEASVTSKVKTTITLNRKEKRMNLPFKLRRTVPVTALAALVLAIGASPALAAPGFSISISGPSTATVGKPVLLKVSGKNPSPAEYWFQT